MTDGVRLTFVAGAEGSGTTLLLRLLSVPATSASLGGNHFKIPAADEAQRLAEGFKWASSTVWDRTLSFAENHEGRRKWRAAWADILASEAFAGISHYLFKRSFPFGKPHGQFVPYLWDVADVCGDVNFIIIYRDPRASTYSALRRGFDQDLRRLALMCSEQLTSLSAQARTLPEDRLHVLSYRRLCSHPSETIERLLVALDLDGEGIRQAAARELPEPMIDDRFRRELPADDVAWLDGFFDERRCRQWDFLRSSAEEQGRSLMGNTSEPVASEKAPPPG